MTDTQSTFLGFPILCNDWLECSGHEHCRQWRSNNVSRRRKVPRNKIKTEHDREKNREYMRQRRAAGLDTWLNRENSYDGKRRRSYIRKAAYIPRGA